MVNEFWGQQYLCAQTVPCVTACFLSLSSLDRQLTPPLRRPGLARATPTPRRPTSCVLWLALFPAVSPKFRSR